ncbi:MAG: outer membrane beta-barrel protein [Hydrogenophilales bacterium]|nr:outer membrane beta-barrel protein [Hydrogenophilales bacterium]
MGFGLVGFARVGIKTIHAGFVALLGAVLALPAWAHEGDTFRPFVSYGTYFDSNLFRLADNASPGTQRDDRYSILSAGLNVDWKPGRQEIVVKVVKTQVRYDRNIRFDSDGSDYQAIWNWRLGNRLSGNLGATETLSQSNFAAVGQLNNLVTQKRRFGRAEWEFHPRWRIGGGVEASDYSNGASSLISQDVQQLVKDVVFGYYLPKGSSLRAQVRRTDANYPNPQVLASTCSFFVFCPPFPVVPSEVVDNSYKQTEYNLLGDWLVSGKLTLHGQAGWVDRQYENVLQGNFNPFFPPQLKDRPNSSGFAGRISADWFPTGKTLLNVLAYQELGGAQDINASSVLKKGVSVNGVWLMREKWRLNAGATFENRFFKGDPGTTQLQRNDDTLSTTLSVSYLPIRAVTVDVGVSAGRRDSNIAVEDYRFHMVYANVRADF